MMPMQKGRMPPPRAEEMDPESEARGSVLDELEALLGQLQLKRFAKEPPPEEMPPEEEAPPPAEGEESEEEMLRRLSAAMGDG